MRIQNLGDSLAPEMVTPAQWADLWHKTKTGTPELRLMLAVLEDAVECYLRAPEGGLRRRKLGREAAKWLFAPFDSRLSFVRVCAALGISPVWLRKGLLRQRRRTALGELAGPLRFRRSAPCIRTISFRPAARPGIGRSATPRGIESE